MLSPLPVPTRPSIFAIESRLHGRYTANLRMELQRTMQQYAPVYRNSEDLKIGKDKVAEIMKKYKDSVKGTTHELGSDTYPILAGIMSKGFDLPPPGSSDPVLDPRAGTKQR